MNSRQSEKVAQQIIEVMGQHGHQATGVLTRIVGICQGLGDVSSDRLRRQAILVEMLAAV